MFTGIITNQGKVAEIDENQLSIESSLAKDLNIGDSISINGICLTVVKVSDHTFSVDYISETKEKTNISNLQLSDPVNLELPATPSSLLSGHIVQGHIDTTAELKEILEKNNQKTFVFEIRDNLSRYMISKGSITINGVSLTIIEVQDKEFSVGVIPHTYASTTFRKLKVGDLANIEVDMLSKYVEKLMKGKK